jgi:DNA polymerase-3 subunit epsilon
MNVSSSARINAIQRARQALLEKPVYLDTETTGLERTDEIVEIAIVDDEGHTLLESLVRSIQVIPREATRIHGITNEMVQHAPSWPVLWQSLRPILVGKLIVIYNVEFDLRMMQQSMQRYRLPWREQFYTFDLLKYYAEYRSDWDPGRRSYRYYSLNAAGQHCRIALPNTHRATADTLLTRALLHFMANTQA